jgi:hypothetical protein
MYLTNEEIYRLKMKAKERLFKQIEAKQAGVAILISGKAH